ncbi:unnamed protein product [Blepharisma stoltei]|uniref:H15 domain-containing protein n=1 Tax=Blepharisma stoltei TaxID=1481888 RepID=A0AAU9IB39_9CILI|nr:unnamed protein product [Blepharisma stoltei]
MELNITRNNSTEPSLCSFAYLFYSTIEGTLIGYLRRCGKATLQELIEHVANSKNLRTKHSKKYKNKNIEKLALSKLAANGHIFTKGQSGIWTLNENAAMEYKQQKIVEIKKIKEIKLKRHESREKKYKKDKNNCRCLKCDID